MKVQDIESINHLSSNGETIKENPSKNIFKEETVLHELKHYLPAQAPLKDFIHHNTLHAFQDLKFHKGLQKASEIFGYKISLSLDEFRGLYNSQRIKDEILVKIISEKKGSHAVKQWKDKLLFQKYDIHALPRIGQLRSNRKIPNGNSLIKIMT